MCFVPSIAYGYNELPRPFNTIVNAITDIIAIARSKSDFGFIGNSRDPPTAGN